MCCSKSKVTTLSSIGGSNPYYMEEADVDGTVFGKSKEVFEIEVSPAQRFMP